jgi:hypothetical protein
MGKRRMFIFGGGGFGKPGFSVNATFGGGDSEFGICSEK